MTQFDPAVHRQRWREILEELDIPDPGGIVDADAGSTNAHVAAHVLVAGIWRLVIEPWRSQRRLADRVGRPDAIPGA
jgi:hypothetical protein